MFRQSPSYFILCSALNSLTIFACAALAGAQRPALMKACESACRRMVYRFSGAGCGCVRAADHLRVDRQTRCDRSVPGAKRHDSRAASGIRACEAIPFTIKTATALTQSFAERPIKGRTAG